MSKFVFIAAFMALVASASAQIDAFLPANTPCNGANVTQPFGGIASAIGNGISWQVVQRIPAAELAAAGLGPGAILKDVYLAPTGTGTISASGFFARIGHSVTSWDSTQLVGNLSGGETIYDSLFHGSLSWSVTVCSWQAIPRGANQALTFSWDGVNDLALYLATLGVNVSSPPSPGPVAVLWIGGMRNAGGLYERNFAPSFSGGSATNSDLNGMKLRLEFNSAGQAGNGTVTFAGPSGPVVAPGGLLAVFFNAASHANEIYMPLVSCTLGQTPLPGSPAVLPLAYDLCSEFYFFHPLGQAMFQITAPGSVGGTLNAGGGAVGSIQPPLAIPAGLSLPMHITFATWDGAALVAHGSGTFTLL